MRKPKAGDWFLVHYAEGGDAFLNEVVNVLGPHQIDLKQLWPDYSGGKDRILGGHPFNRPGDKITWLTPEQIIIFKLTGQLPKELQ